MFRVCILLFGAFFLWGCQSFSPDWSDSAQLPESGERTNVYQQSPDDFKASVARGLQHALVYPVTNTGLLLPLKTFQKIIDTPEYDKFEVLMMGQSFKDLPEFYKWLGLSPFPTEGTSGSSAVPFPEGQPKDLLMGAGLMQRGNMQGLTFSCAACHAGSFFGASVMGMATRRPRANEVFVLGKQLGELGYDSIVEFLGEIDKDESGELKGLLNNLGAVGVQRPQVLGLDTSLAQVALSLARRNEDPYATKSDELAKKPRTSWPANFVADSKPMVWWTMKYKTRWLADGSIVQGNPVHTNFLWNELGRGSDLKKLEEWLLNNKQVIRDLTAAVFATPAPRYGDFFGWDSINLDDAKAGQAIFNERCSRCHGTYKKGWDDSSLAQGSLADQMKTTEVRYPSPTPVHDVGTDPNRYEGMKYFAESLNQLAISKSINTVVKPQKGYVPPPLNGIFARYPYLHNNSIPNLCALLTPASQRPISFYQGPAENKATDVDLDCMGYPTGDAIPEAWKEKKEILFDATKPGLSNQGHDVGIFVDEQGKSLITDTQRKQLIAFLKTL
ncbi:MAG: hypothetical protein EP343_23050 [Deltaproteobacteria bacterium]|nr:MAG: hypothetical protein EP343_23050 [Deltaproteobacteria bacterium]